MTAIPQGAIEWISRLVSFDTVSRHSNLGLIEAVRDDLARLGVRPILTHDDAGGKANLFATIPAWDGGTQGGIVLSGHTDTVPVDGQTWTTNPFKAEVRDGKLYGRGTCDMKGFIGTALSLVPHFLNLELKQPIHLALSYDEEVGCVGAPVMLRELLARGVRPDGCIVGEPTSMRVIVAHKGVNIWRCCVKGHAAHSSLTTHGSNAIEHAAKLISFMRDAIDEMKVDGPFDDDFDVPFSTAQVGTITGGMSVNTIPNKCEFEFEYRNLPGVDPTAFFGKVKEYAENVLLPRMRAEHPYADIAFVKLAGAPYLEAQEQAAVTQLVRTLTGDGSRRKVAYGTEAGQFQEAGIPSVICGPGNIEQAHKSDEFVEVNQVLTCADFLRKVSKSLAR